MRGRGQVHGGGRQARVVRADGDGVPLRARAGEVHVRERVAPGKRPVAHRRDRALQRHAPQPRAAAQQAARHLGHRGREHDVLQRGAVFAQARLYPRHIVRQRQLR